MIKRFIEKRISNIVDTKVMNVLDNDSTFIKDVIRKSIEDNSKKIITKKIIDNTDFEDDWIKGVFEIDHYEIDRVKKEYIRDYFEKTSPEDLIAALESDDILRGLQNNLKDHCNRIYDKSERMMDNIKDDIHKVEDIRKEIERFRDFYQRGLDRLEQVETSHLNPSDISRILSGKID